MFTSQETTMIRGRGGRKTLLQRENITVNDLLTAYKTLGTYDLVGEKYHVTGRTIRNYLTPLKVASKGRPRAAYSSAARRWLEDNIEVLRLPDKDILKQARKLPKSTVSVTYLQRVLQDKRRRVTNLVESQVKSLLRDNAAIRDTKGRYIPTKAIRYAWLTPWEWDRPVYIRVVLRDGTKTKLPTLYHPTIDDARETI